MANAAQCYYCFESLLASFEDREPVNLATVEALWEQHEHSKKLSSLKNEAVLDQDAEDAEERAGPQQSVNDDDDDDDDSKQSSHPSRHPKGLKLPRISRLQSQISSDTSSAATTPSATSNTSSNSLLSNSTAVTTPGTQSETSSSRHPLFVTWNTLSHSGHKSLRGCIGTFEPQDLAVGLKSYSLTSYVGSLFSHLPLNPPCLPMPLHSMRNANRPQSLRRYSLLSNSQVSSPLPLVFIDSPRANGAVHERTRLDPRRSRDPHIFHPPRQALRRYIPPRCSR